MEKQRKIQVRKSQGLKIIVFVVILLIVSQGWLLLKYYKELVIKIPPDLFKSPKQLPQSELIIDLQGLQTGSESADTTATDITTETATTDDSSIQGNDTGDTATQTSDSSDDSSIVENNTTVLSDIQKEIVLKLMDILNQNITYGYKVFPKTGYPDENTWISTDVISVTLRDVGYDLMELIYNDMKAHKEDYPLDIKKEKAPNKYLDFRDVFFQEQFFKRNALELDIEYIKDNKDNIIQWQPGDIVYFQFDPDNPYNDLGGFISSHTNLEGVPLVIMISSEFGKVSEVDKLLEYKIVGHYRYPNPYNQ
jgi:uncharacterized protein